MQDVIEHGVLFHRTPDNATEQKKTATVLKYWVIGCVFIITEKVLSSDERARVSACGNVLRVSRMGVFDDEVT